MLAAAFLSSCDPEIDAPAVSRGDADFSKYVSLGNSLTSGFADAALYRSGQEVSYPNILAQQFKLAGGGEFKQPLITVGAAGDIGIGSSANAKLVLRPKTDCKGTTSLSPVPATANGAGDLSIFAPGNFIGSQGPYNNLGVPGARSFHLLAPNYGNPAGLMTNPRTANPFFARFVSSPSKSVLEEAMAQSPTFFTLWIGNNDVLEYALSGGTLGTAAITSPTGGSATAPSFDMAIGGLLGGLTANNAKGAIANIPDVTKIPYCTTVPYNGLTLDTTQAAGLSQAYAPLGIKFRVGRNPFMIADAAAPGKMRQIKANELVLLSVPKDSLKCAGWGSLKPIPDQYVLTAAEIGNITNAVLAYNAIIKNLADAKGIAHIDAYTYLRSLTSGVKINEVSYNTALVTGNVFSLDGIHFSPRGNALAANLFIEAINRKYNATIPTVDPNAYNGVLFP